MGLALIRSRVAVPEIEAWVALESVYRAKGGCHLWSIIGSSDNLW